MHKDTLQCGRDAVRNLAEVGDQQSFQVQSFVAVYCSICISIMPAGIAGGAAEQHLH